MTEENKVSPKVLKLSEANKKTMLKCLTFKEWARRHLRVKPTPAFEEAFKLVHK